MTLLRQAARRRRRRIAALSAAIVLSISAVGALRAQTPVGPEMRFERSIQTGHGSASNLTWSADGSAVYLANEEGSMSAVRIDGRQPDWSTIKSNADADFLWSVAEARGLLVFRASLSNVTLRVDPQTFKTIWRKNLGEATGHGMATDGSRVFIPIEGSTGTLLTVDANGNVVGRAPVRDAWGEVYGVAYDAGTHRVYVAVRESRRRRQPPQSRPGAQQGAPQRPAGTPPPEIMQPPGGPPDLQRPTAGGVYIFDAGASSATLLGMIPEQTSYVAVSGTRLWRTAGSALEAWNVAQPQAPVRQGAVVLPTEAQGGRQITREFQDIRVNAAGTRLYAVYGGPQMQGPSTGFAVFDVRGSTPVQLAEFEWKTDFKRPVAPAGLAVSPDGTTLAVAYPLFGVRFFRVAGDTITPTVAVTTSGEARDVYVDAQGFQYVFAWDNFQTFDAAGRRVETYLSGGPADGGWAPFVDGTVVMPSGPSLVLDLRGGHVTVKGVLAPRTLGHAWQVLYEAPYVYATIEPVRGRRDGGLFVGRIGQVAPDPRSPYPGSVYDLTEAALAPIAGHVFSFVKSGTQIWCLSDEAGVVAFDVSNPAAPRQIFQDAFTFRVNGPHARIVAAHGRIYAGAGDASLRIYDPRALRRTGGIEGFTVTFLETIGQDFLVLTNYWYPRLPQGMYVYDLRKNPDNPDLADRYPRSGRASDNFRARVFGRQIYRVSLRGLDVFAWP